MEWSSLPWKDGIAAVLAFVLLKILYDLCYKTIPQAFRTINKRMVKLETVANVFIEDHKEAMATLTTLALSVKQNRALLLKRKRVREKKSRRASPADKPLK